MKDSQVLVVGASGMVGSELTRLLRAQGLKVRTTTSKKTKDKDQCHINLVTGEGVKEAFEGVDRAFYSLRQDIPINTPCFRL